MAATKHAVHTRSGEGSRLIIVVGARGIDSLKRVKRFTHAFVIYHI